MDIFGFKTQGINYDKFRPTYPAHFLNHILSSVKHKNKYLDIATGTGQLLFAIAPHFASSKGMDISSQMIKTAQGKLGDYKDAKIDLQVGGVMDIDESVKYDLITVGQALHFFPIEDSLRKIRRLLQPEGKFVTFGYILKTAQSKNPDQGKIFNTFYSKVKPLFTFDRDELHTHYSDKERYPFEKVFGKVEREVSEVPLNMNKLEYLSYLKTMSGYNLYLEKNKEDPLVEVEQQCAEDVTLLLDYFRIECTL